MAETGKRKLESTTEREVKVKLEEPDTPVKLENGASNNNSNVKQEEDVEMRTTTTTTGLIVCPYLDTIERKVLDFDFEKLCSVSLASLNVYACLVCGKYFQGRGKSTYAYLHSLEADHHVFINLETEKIYCLPDGYEVIDTSLADIQYNLHPRFNHTKVLQFDSNTLYTHALDGTDYLPGVVGLNNTKSTDWLNVVVQALSRVPIIRNHYIAVTDYKATLPDGSFKNEMARRFGEILCKMWNAENFKGHVSPHEILQAVSAESGKKFKIGTQSDPLKFLSWFLHTLHRLHSKKDKRPNPISRAFEGELLVTSQKMDESQEITRETKPFFYLSLDLPPAPLFKDNVDQNIIPQVPLFDLLSKFDGDTEEIVDGVRKKYIITRLPRYLIIHVKRFTQNNWFVEKNPTLVNFPIKNLDMKAFKKPREIPSTDTLESMSVKALKAMAAKRKIDTSRIVEKDDLVGKLAASFAAKKEATKYDLIANICHDGKPDQGTYRVHIYHAARDTWFELQDLHVWSTETMPQLVALSETYIQIYALQNQD